jgi:hypothetical protein
MDTVSFVVKIEGGGETWTTGQSYIRPAMCLLASLLKGIFFCFTCRYNVVNAIWRRGMGVG